MRLRLLGTTSHLRATHSPRATFDRVARTELGTLWYLIPFATITGLFAAAIPAKGRGAAAFFAGVAALAAATFIWAWFERRAAHRTLERLQAAQRLTEGRGEAAKPGTPPERVLRQYTVFVGFLVLGATFQTHFHARHRPLLATLVTVLLGWWTFPWGPVRTVKTVLSNLRGGTARSEAHLLAELSLKTPPPAPWWMRMLALDSKNPIRIASSLATLGMVVVVILLVLTAFMRAMLGTAQGP